MTGRRPRVEVILVIMMKIGISHSAKSIFSALFLLLLATASAQDLFQSNLQYGIYKAGFKNIDATDYTRPALPSPNGKEQQGRQMNLSIWYPSTAVSGGALQYSEYVSLAIPPWQRTGSAALRQTIMQTVAELSGDTSLFKPVMQKLLSAPGKAYKNAAPARGTFPVIFFPDRPHVQSIMCEYLASHGYIVVSPVISGTHSASMEYSITGIESAVQDLQFALGYVRRHFSTKKQFSVMGLGFNATNVLSWQMRNPDINGMISLEGGITTGFEDQLIERSPFFNTERCTTAMLIVHAPHPDVNPALTHKYKYASRIYQHYPQSSEFYFLNFGIWEKTLRNIFPKANKGDAWLSFEHAAQSVKNFLDWKLRGSETAKAALLQEKPGIAAVTVKEGNLLPPSAEELGGIIRQRGIAAATALYLERKKADDQPFPFGSFFRIGQNLIQQSAFNDLQEWARLFADSYPQSAIPYTMQGRAMLELGNKEQAKALYTRAAGLVQQDANLNEAEKRVYHTAIENRLKGLN